MNLIPALSTVKTVSKSAAPQEFLSVIKQMPLRYTVVHFIFRVAGGSVLYLPTWRGDALNFSTKAVVKVPL